MRHVLRLLLAVEGDFGAAWPYDCIFLANRVSVTGFCHLKHLLLLQDRSFRVLVAEGMVLTAAYRMQILQLLLVVEGRVTVVIMIILGTFLIWAHRHPAAFMA